MIGLRNRHGRIAATRPNWRSPVSVSYEFRTGIISSFEDHEQRESFRTTARISCQFETLLTGEMYRRYFADMTAPNTPFAVAAEWRASTLSVSAPAGSGTLTFSPLPTWIETGAQLIVSTVTHEELVSVIGISGSMAVLSVPTTFAFAAGDRVFLAYSAYAQESVNFSAFTDDLLVGMTNYDVVPASAPQSFGGAVGTLFEGEEVLTRRPDWRFSPQVATAALRDIFDSGRGKTLVSAAVARLKRTQKLAMNCHSEADIEAVTAFFLRKRGMRTAFWVPTWLNDIVPMATVVTGTKPMIVAGTEFRAAFAGSDIHNVAIAFEGSAIQANRIESITDDGTNSTLNFKDNWIFDVTPTTKVCWLHRSRFSTDVLEVRYLSDGRADIEYAVEPIRNEAP